MALRFIVTVGVAFSSLGGLSVGKTVEGFETESVLGKTLRECFLVEIDGDEVEENLLDKDDDGC